MEKINLDACVYFRNFTLYSHSRIFSSTFNLRKGLLNGEEGYIDQKLARIHQMEKTKQNKNMPVCIFSDRK